jgi:hypothetical protein
MRPSSRIDGVRPSIGPSITLAALLLTLCALPAANLAGPVDESLATPRAELALPGRLRYPTPEVRRDPFVTNADVPVAAGGLEDAVAGIVLPPNAGASGASQTTGVAVVRGVLLGTPPSALVETGGRVVFVHVGSPLLGTLVSSIGASGVALQDGETLRFPEKHP